MPPWSSENNSLCSCRPLGVFFFSPEGEGTRGEAYNASFSSTTRSHRPCAWSDTYLRETVRPRRLPSASPRGTSKSVMPASDMHAAEASDDPIYLGSDDQNRNPGSGVRRGKGFTRERVSVLLHGSTPTQLRILGHQLEHVRQVWRSSDRPADRHYPKVRPDEYSSRPIAGGGGARKGHPYPRLATVPPRPSLTARDTLRDAFESALLT